MNSFIRLWTRKRILRNKRITGCMFLITLVMIPLVIALIFSESMISGITDKYIYLSDGHIQNDSFVDNKEIIKYCDKTVKGSAILYSDTQTSQVVIKGVTSSYFNDQRLNNLSFIENSDSSSKLKKITISQSVSKKLNVKTGDKIALMIVPDNSKFSVRPALVEVSSIFTTGYDNLDKNLAYMDLDDALSLFDNSCIYEIILNEDYAKDIYKAVNQLDLKDYSLWSDYNYSVYENFVSSRQMILIILILIIIIASFYTAMLTNQIINEDMKEIAQVKLLGAKNKDVMLSAFLSVYFVIAIGLVLGIVIGIIISYLLGPLLSFLSHKAITGLSYYLLDFSITIPYTRIILISVVLLLLSFISIRLCLRKTKKIGILQLFNK